MQRGLPAIVDAGREDAALAAAAGGADAVFGWELSYEQKAGLDTLDCGRRVVDPDWHAWHDPEAGGAGKARHMLPKDAVLAGF